MSPTLIVRGNLDPSSRWYRAAAECQLASAASVLTRWAERHPKDIVEATSPQASVGQTKDRFEEVVYK